ncbi:hypothetical protein ACJ7V3_17360 [Halomonas elongata]|uniref:hypothetical protein n=1 Tax=Halomonas elongata TaxID=2746 RepID=UPI0038D3EFB6
MKIERAYTIVTDEVFPHDYCFEDGLFLVGEMPEHGVDIDEEQARKHPYRRAGLPVNRLENGAL